MDGTSVHSAVTMGNRADSFYEYLLKGWLLTGKKDEVVACVYVHSRDFVACIKRPFMECTRYY